MGVPPVCEMVSQHKTREMYAPEPRASAICHHPPQTCHAFLPAGSATPMHVWVRFRVDHQTARPSDAPYVDLQRSHTQPVEASNVEVPAQLLFLPLVKCTQLCD